MTLTEKNQDHGVNPRREPHSGEVGLGHACVPDGDDQPPSTYDLILQLGRGLKTQLAAT